MLSMYPACFFKEDAGYSVIFPDLNHLATCGDTLEEALSMAVDCLAGYLFALAREGKRPADPSDISAIKIDKVAAEMDIDDATQAFVNLVSVDVAEYAKAHFERSVKKTLSIPEWLNAAAIEQGVNFSQVLQEALKQRLRA